MRIFSTPFRSIQQGALLFISAILVSCAPTAPAPQDEANFRALQDVLQASFSTVSGGHARLSDFQGRIVLLNFFSSWCSECPQQIASLRNLADSFQQSDFSVVGVAISNDPLSAREFVSKLSVPFTVLLDESGDLKQFFSINQLPVTILLDRSGVPLQFQDPRTGAVTSKLEGARRWDTEGPVTMIAGLVETR